MKKNKLILLQLVIAFTLICTSVYAAFNTTISLSASTNTLKRGEEITVTLSLKDVDADNKVHSVEGYINYDKDILEPLTVDSIEKTSENTVKIGNEELSVEDVTNKTDVSSSDAGITFNGSPSSGNDAKILIDFKDGITENTDLLKIKFKVKSDAKLGTVTNAISYKTFQITAGTQTSADIDQSINLTVVANSEEDPGNKPENKPENKQDDKPENKPANNGSQNANTNKNTNTNRNTNTNTNKNTNKNTNTNTNKNTNKNVNNTNKNSNTDNTVAGTSIPATGSKIVVVPAIVLIALAYISYNKYMKYKDI